MKNLKKVLVVSLVLVLVFNYLEGAKKKKKNINKYIFAGENLLIVFDGESKTIQKKRFGTNSIRNILYFPKYKKIILNANYCSSLYSIDVNDLNNYYEVDLSRFNKYGKPKNFIGTFTKKKDKNQVLFEYAEWNYDWDSDSFYGMRTLPEKYKQGYLWNVKNNSFTKFSLPKNPWDMQKDGSLQLPDDPYEASFSFPLYKLGDMEGLKKEYDEVSGSSKSDKRVKKMWKRNWKYGKKFLKLLKKNKIDVGPYSQPSDLYFKSTGGRYMVIRNDKLYLVHMKTKKVYTLMDNPFMGLRYFIIEKNEDDLDLDKE